MNTLFKIMKEYQNKLPLKYVGKDQS